MIMDLSGAEWFKSSKSANASECVEVAFLDPRPAEWFKSSKSPNASECVEIAFADQGGSHVGVRDSKDPGPVLVFSGDQWDRFLASGIWTS